MKRYPYNRNRIMNKEKDRTDMAKILIVEDDTDINNLLARIMRQQGYEAVQSFSGTEGKLRLELEQYDLMLLDLMLPGMKGEDLIREIRRTDPDLPIIVLSAKSALEDRVSVLELGADDYLVKPFAVEEVAARVAGALRRSARQQELLLKENGRPTEKAGSPGSGKNRINEGTAVNSPEQGNDRKSQRTGADAVADDRFRTQDSEQILRFRNLTLAPSRREVRVKGQLVSLTAHEYDILYILMQEPGKVYSRERLYELVWQGGYYGEDNTVNVHVSNLRKKIAAADPGEYIATVWGIGFRMAQG